MKKFNLLRKSERKSVGTTLALTVGSPSAHRRYSALKHLTFMLLFLLGSLNVWGASPETISFASYSTSGTASQADFVITWDGNTSCTIVQAKGTGNNVANNTTSPRWYQNNSITITPKSGITITKIVFTGSGSSYNGQTMSFSAGSGSVSSNATTWNGSITSSSSLVVTPGKQFRPGSVVVTYTTGGTTEPSLTVTPATIDFGTVEQGASVAAKTVAVTYANLTGSVTYSGLSDAFAATGTISASGDEITITPSTATIGEYEQTLTIQSTADSKSQDVTVTMNVVAPFDGKKLTFDVSSNPGEWPTSNSTTTTNYTYTLNEVDYTFALNNVKCNSGYLMLTSVAKLGLPAISGYKLVKVEATNSGSCSTSTQVSVSSSDASKTDVTGGAAQTWGTTNTKYTYNLSETEENTMYYLWIANRNCQIVELTLYYEEVAASAVAKPTISGEASFLTSTTVTLTQAEADAIYYTTDGSDPKTSGDKLTYSAPFTINADGTTTVKAYAVKGSDESDVTEKTFTKIEPLATMDAIFAAATSTATDKYITFSNTWVVTGVSTNGQTAYITDGTKGMILFNNSATAQSPVGGLAVGNTLSGTKQCTLVLYGGAAEIKNFTADGLTKGNGDLPNVQTLDATGISNLSAVNTGSLIKISGAATQNGTKYYVANVQLYNNLFSFTAPTPGSNYECTGVYVHYNSTNEICPRAAEDLVQETEKSQANTYWNDVASASLTIRANESVTALWSTESTGAKHFASSAEGVATIAADGTITIQGVGTTVLTYTTDENNDYYSGTATLTLTVKAALPAGGEEVTWNAVTAGYSDASEITGNVISSNSHVSIVLDQGTGNNSPKWYNNGNAVRVYQNNTITISAKENNKLIYEVSVNFTSGNTSTYNDVLSVSGTTGTWQGVAKSLQLTSPAANRIQSISVIYADGTETTLSIANVALKTTDGATDIVPTCNVVPTPTITYSGNNVQVATIDDGKITPVGIGSTTVTARIAQGSNYTAAETTFTITVAAKTIPEMSFPHDEYNANLGESFTAPTLTKPDGVIVEYSSNNAAVSVDATTGAITLNTDGTAVITATSVESEDYAVGTATYTLNVIDPNKDVLTAAGIGRASYGNWSKSFTTAIVYAGNSTTNADRIQLRVSSGTQDPSGIVTTSTIGYLKSISAAAASGNTDGHKLQIYAKSTAYESAADLYDAEKRGTLIGTIAEDGGNIVFEEGKGYADHYKYIGIKSASGAVYYDDIIIAWTPAVFEKYSVTYNAGEGSGENVVVSNIEEGTTIQLATKPEGFTYADHAFAGWKLDNAGETLAAGVDYEVNSNVTFVAQWSEAFAITYKAGEGTGDDVVVENVASGAYSLAVCPNTFEAPDGKIFVGWKLENVEEDVRAAGSSYTVSGSVAFVAQWLTANVVTFVAGTDKSESSPLIKSGITIEATTFNNNDYYQCYSGNSMTISSEVGEIIKIEITTVARESSKYNASCFSAEGYSYGDVNSTEGVWNGSAESVVFTASAQVRMTQIVVTYIPNGNVPKQPAGLSYETTSYVITQGNPFTAPTLNNPNGLVVTYSGNNDAVATVDENSGAITLGGATGSVTITASAEEQGNYYAGTATYTLTVNEPSDDLTGTWNLVTDASDLMAGMQVIVASVADGEGALYTLGGPNGASANNRIAVAGTASSSVLTPAAGTKVLTLVDAGEGKFALQLTNGNYLYAQGGNSKNYLKERSDINNQATWTITIEEGIATIKADVSGRNWIRYNKDNNPKIFSCYASGQQDIVLYAKPFDYTRNVSGNYGTICLPKAGKIYGASLYEIAYYGETSKKIFFDEIVNGEMEAGIPYIFLPAAGAEKIGVYYLDNTAADAPASNRNGLYGFYNLNDPAATHDITQDAGYYILYNNQYWLVSGRAAYVENYRAYIYLADITPSEPALAPGRRRISMSVNDTQTATGIESAEANEAPHKVLINGELFILRGEKMYDAKGQLVK